MCLTDTDKLLIDTQTPSINIGSKKKNLNQYTLYSLQNSLPIFSSQTALDTPPKIHAHATLAYSHNSSSKTDQSAHFDDSEEIKKDTAATFHSAHYLIDYTPAPGSRSAEASERSREGESVQRRTPWLLLLPLQRNQERWIDGRMQVCRDQPFRHLCGRR